MLKWYVPFLFFVPATFVMTICPKLMLGHTLGQILGQNKLELPIMYEIQ